MSRTKQDRLSLRITPEQKAVLKTAASLRHTTVTAFMVEKACQAAHEVLAEDRYRYMLNDEAWDRFCAALDAPPKENPKLQRLLQKPSILDG
jgi:uncharacterized protein (DUF1778 family)